jgi:hypothetical protein
MDELVLSTDPLDPQVFETYSVHITSEWDTEGGIGYTGDVLHKGEHIFSFENDGIGNATQYLYASNKAPFREFKTLCEEQFPNKFEPIDLGLIYLEVRDIENN